MDYSGSHATIYTNILSYHLTTNHFHLYITKMRPLSCMRHQTRLELLNDRKNNNDVKTEFNIRKQTPNRCYLIGIHEL